VRDQAAERKPTNEQESSSWIFGQPDPWNKKQGVPKLTKTANPNDQAKKVEKKGTTAGFTLEP
jgi:hypothetical protein